MRDGSVVKEFGSALQAGEQKNQNLFMAAFDLDGNAKWIKNIESKQQVHLMFAKLLNEEKIVLHVRPYNYTKTYSSEVIMFDNQTRGYRNTISQGETNADSYIVQYDKPSKYVNLSKATRLRDNSVMTSLVRGSYLYLIDTEYVLRRLSLGSTQWNREFDTHLWQIQLRRKYSAFKDLVHFEDGSVALLEKLDSSEIAEIEYRLTKYDRYLQISYEVSIEVLEARYAYSTELEELKVLANGHVSIKGQSQDTLDVNRIDVIEPVTIWDDVQLEISSSGDLVSADRQAAE